MDDGSRAVVACVTELAADDVDVATKDDAFDGATPFVEDIGDVGAELIVLLTGVVGVDESTLEAAYGQFDANIKSYDLDTTYSFRASCPYPQDIQHQGCKPRPSSIQRSLCCSYRISLHLGSWSHAAILADSFW